MAGTGVLVLQLPLYTQLVDLTLVLGVAVLFQKDGLDKIGVFDQAVALPLNGFPKLFQGLVRLTDGGGHILFGVLQHDAFHPSCRIYGQKGKAGHDQDGGGQHQCPRKPHFFIFLHHDRYSAPSQYWRIVCIMTLIKKAVKWIVFCVCVQKILARIGAKSRKCEKISGDNGKIVMDCRSANITGRE